MFFYSGFLVHICENYFLLDEIVQEQENVATLLAKSLKKSNRRTEVSAKDSLEMILGRVDLSSVSSRCAVLTAKMRLFNI